MFKQSVVAVAILNSACAVAWTDLRIESRRSGEWRCPRSTEVHFTGGYTTNTHGSKHEKPDRPERKELGYRQVAEAVLRGRGCPAEDDAEADTLSIEIAEMQQISALPQEFLTGLSFGLVPSWGTRPAEVRFSFSQGTRESVYVVDEIRINHVLMIPVFWTTFLLVDYERDFRDALDDFASGHQQSDPNLSR